jgi:hypothetical protein
VAVPVPKRTPMILQAWTMARTAMGAENDNHILSLAP